MDYSQKQRSAPTSKMPHSALNYPLVPALIDEFSLVITTIWILPIIKETIEGWIEFLGILRAIFLHFAL
jgi:hypothetical protein